MIHGTILDRRSSQDRREGEVSTYNGPDRRKSGERRDGKITICVFCGEICGEKKGWYKTPNLKDLDTDYQIYICDTCAAKLNQPLYSEHRVSP